MPQIKYVSTSVLSSNDALGFFFLVQVGQREKLPEIRSITYYFLI